jgi:hypothetical protein
MLRFPYLPVAVQRPVYPLAGAQVRHYPVINVAVSCASGDLFFDGLVDSAADDTIFPLSVARRLGIDLSNAPLGEARAVGGGTFSYHYAHVTLRVSDGRETCEWDTIVGFLDARLRWALLGQTGFLPYFDVQLLGARREVLLAPDATFTGQHTVHSPRQGPP